MLAKIVQNEQNTKIKLLLFFISEVQPIFETKYQRYKKMKNERVKK